MGWSDDERLRFERELIEAIEDEHGRTIAPVPGSLRLVVGGEQVRVTWASRGSGKVTQATAELRPGTIAGVMYRAADKLREPDGAGG